MRITLNKIDFEIGAVTVAERTAILADPMIAPAIWREVWRWDHTKGTGAFVTKGVTSKGQLILPNGVLFFVPKADGSRAPGPSEAMGKRILETLKAKSAVDIMRAVASIVQIPQMKLPREAFAPIEKAASYSMRMYTEYSVLRMRNASRNLSFVIALPGQCIYHHEVTAKDDVAYDALIESRPELAKIQLRYILAPTSDANRNMRAMALSAWLSEMKAQIEAKTAGGVPLEDPALQSDYARALSEIKVLAQSGKGKQPAPART